MAMHIVMTASAKMPSSCKGRYGKVAVVQLDQHHTARNLRPAMISERAKGVLRIVRTWDRLNIGGPRSAFALAKVEAEEMAYRLNSISDMADAAAIIGAGGSA